MTKYTLFVILFALFLHVGCSGDSQKDSPEANFITRFNGVWIAPKDIEAASGVVILPAAGGGYYVQQAYHYNGTNYSELSLVESALVLNTGNTPIKVFSYRVNTFDEVIVTEQVVYPQESSAVPSFVNAYGELVAWFGVSPIGHPFSQAVPLPDSPSSDGVWRGYYSVEIVPPASNG